MYIKFLLKIFSFILLNYNISNCIYASNTDNLLSNKEQNNTLDDNNQSSTDNKDNNNKNNIKNSNNINKNNKNDNIKNNNEENTNSDNDSNDDKNNETNGEEDNEEEDDDEGENDEDNEDDNDDEEEDDVYADKDPLEKFNRVIFNFNDKMNNVLNKITSSNKAQHEDKSKKNEQSKASKAIGNFSHNFFEAPRIVNYALQGNIKNMSNSIARLIINTAFGFFGVTDVAEKLGFKKNDTYFGDTLKKWGMKPGPYVVLPILGPTSLRGTIGKIFEILPMQLTKLPLHNFKPFTKNAIYYATYCCSLLATRSAYGDMIETVSSMSKDKYKTFRNIIMSMENN